MTLEGSIDSWSQREDTERAVRNLSGVRNVVDRIAVRSTRVNAGRPAGHHRCRSSAALRETKNIDVAVRDGRVTVTGGVHSREEKQAVLGAVRGTSGVRDLDDHLRIDS